MAQIIIVGAGVLGLSTAIQLSTTYSVTVIARELPGDIGIDYASPWAGAHFRPSPANTNPAEKLEQSLMRETYHRLEQIAKTNPEAGIEFVPAVEYFDSADASFLAKENGYTDWPGFRVLDSSEYPSASTGAVRLGVTYRAWVLNSPVYLKWLRQRAEGQGVRFIKAELTDLRDAVAVYYGRDHGKGDVRAVVNASGRGFDDQDSFPSRGQFVIVSNLCDRTVSHHCLDGSSTVVIPRPLGGGTVIGGTKEPNNWSEEISDASTDDILQRVRDLCPDMVDQQGEALAATHGFDVKQVYVARRPMRKGGLRLERDLLINDARPSCPLIHCYGAGASGFKISWGAASRVNELVDQISAEIN